MKVIVCFVGLMMGMALACRADVDARAIALNCVICHHDGAENANDIPSLEGLTETQLRQSLLDFKYDKTPSTLMSRIAKGYSDDELAAVAAFIHNRP